ncbi:hypothetical protein PHYPSEUDO_010143 [Phytophthora pseudosyringae]|uniref:Uncharacterized protein n=1 Tax=Phytophthora pseudosyringae TaxID=221518 RepID=A0A8T1VBF8_9STRA|nr:hypothetical protein PHYPSEUDO_010143 [Phytophthora pseudosyringae]
MNQITKLLDDQAVPLDEILAFIDSSDFDLPMAEAPQDVQLDPFDDSIQDPPLHVALAPSEQGRQALGNNQEGKCNVAQRSQVASATSAPSDSETQSGALDRRAASPVAPYKGRGRVRDRVIRLRAMATQLERQLYDLNSSKSRGAVDGPPREGDTQDENTTDAGNVAREGGDSKTSGGVVTWQQLAIRHFVARREAEKENQRLRERLEEQLRVAKRLELLIRGQQL